MNRVEDVERKIVSLWEDIAETRGFDRVLGRVICTLLIEGRPLSQREIAEKTGYSVPTISKTLKVLVSLGSGRKMKKLGKRVTLYYVDMHPLEILSGALMKWILTAKTMEQRASEILQELVKIKDEDPERSEKLMKMLMRFTASIPKMIEIMENAIGDMQRLGDSDHESA